MFHSEDLVMNGGNLNAFFCGLVCLFIGIASPGCIQLPIKEEAEEAEGPPPMTQAQLISYAQAEQLLVSEEPATREKAAIKLLGMGRPEATEAVLERMQNAEDPQARVDMIRAAAFCRAHRCFEAILESIKDPSDKVKRAAADALGHFGKSEEIEAMKKIAGDSSTSPRVRELLYRSLGEGIFLQATPVLLQGLDDSHPQAAEAALWALRHMSGRNLSGEPARWEKWWAANRARTREELLEERIWKLESNLKISQKKRDELQDELDELSSLMRYSARSNPGRLVKALLSEHRRIREHAAYKLSSLDRDMLKSVSLSSNETYETLRQALVRSSPAIRENIVEVVVKLEGNHRNTLLLEALNDHDPDVLVTAIGAVNQQMGKPAVERLKELLQHTKPSVRESAANALGKVGSDDAVQSLLGVLNDKAENVRWFGVESLRKLDAVRAVPRLCEVLENDESARVREITANALGDIGQPAAVPVLREALADKNERVREAAVSALKSLAESNFERALIIAEILKKKDRGEAAIEVLRKGIQEFGDNEELVEQTREARLELAEILERQEDFVGAATVYREIVARGHDDMKIRSEFIDCWFKAGEPQRILELMKKWLDSDEGGKLEALVDLGLETVKKLRKADEQELATQVLEVLTAAATRAGEEKLLERLKKAEIKKPEKEGADNSETEKEKEE
ncbi:MAG: HEAT repeat domain-containing protein [Candidatus Brocadiia bacterium]